jgi:hypothetical protein
MINADQQKTLRAVLERIIPADEFAGACEAGVDGFVIGLLDRELKDKAQAIAAGLDALQAESKARHGIEFTALDAAAQDELLATIESTQTKTPWTTDPAAWFSQLITLAMEGFYSDPSNGGNKNEVSWKMIGYDPGKARHG